MKKIKMLFGLLLSLLIGCFSLPAAAEDLPLLCGDFQYELREEGAFVTGYLGSGPDMIFPASIDGRPVVGVDSCGRDQHIKRIVLPAAMRIIEHSAFLRCPNLETVEVADSPAPDGIESPDVRGVVRQSAFEYCPALKSVELPEGIQELESNIFVGCSQLERVVLPEGLERIGDFAFRDCTALRDVWLPDSLTWIGALGFSGCFELRVMHIPPHLRLGHGVFIDFATYEPLDITYLVHPLTEGAAVIQLQYEYPNLILTEKTACGVMAGVKTRDGDAMAGFQAEKALPAYIGQARQALQGAGLPPERLAAVYETAFTGEIKPQKEGSLLLPVAESSQPPLLYRLEPDGKITPLDGQQVGKYMYCPSAADGVYLILQEEQLLGDLDFDGNVTIADVMEACKTLARSSEGRAPADAELLRGDFNGDGELCIADIMELCRMLAQKA